jgi:RNA polymerase sigma-70 factor (ECF subfamily)
LPPHALDPFFRQYFPVIQDKCSRMLGDTEEAADIAQETFLRLCGSPVIHESVAARLTWLYQTSTRLAIDRLRRRRLGIEVPAEAELEAPAPASPADGVVAARQWLARLAADLSPAELEVAILVRFDDMTQDEVAQVTELSTRTIRRMLERLDERLGRLSRRLS